MSDAGRPVRPSLADTLQSVLWEYNEDEHRLSPLVATLRYFESFPWEGPEEISQGSGEPAAGPGPGSPGQEVSAAQERVGDKITPA